MSTSYRGVKEAFDAAATTYDALRRQLIPCFDDYYGTVGRLDCYYKYLGFAVFGGRKSA
ncbi:MAG: hypothetical protein AAB092_06865 [Chloroflexota bacterium]